MLKDSQAFSGFSVNDLAAAKQFYSQKLGLEVEQDKMGMHLKISGVTPLFVYEKADHVPASYTILNFPVTNIETAVDELVGNGVVFEQYDFGNGAKTDDKGIMHGRAAKMGLDIAWFKDPAGNTLAVLQD